MRVQFDLRPSGIVEKEHKQRSFNLTRLIAILLMGLFFASSIGYLVIMTARYFILKDEVLSREVVVSGLEAENMALTAQVGELKARENVFAETLRIMNDELPTLEVLKVLENNIDDYGIGINTLNFAGGSVIEITGQVASETQIINFSDRLRASGIFNDVLMPVTTLNEGTGMISFTLRMPVKSVSEINRP